MWVWCVWVWCMWVWHVWVMYVSMVCVCVVYVCCVCGCGVCGCGVCVWLWCVWMWCVWLWGVCVWLWFVWMWCVWVWCDCERETETTHSSSPAGVLTFSSGRLAGRFRSLTFGNSGSNVPSLDRGEYATVCLLTSFLPVSLTQAAPFLEYITS